MTHFIKINNEIINLDNVSRIELQRPRKLYQPERTVYDVCVEFNGTGWSETGVSPLTARYSGEEAEALRWWLDQNLDEEQDVLIQYNSRCCQYGGCVEPVYPGSKSELCKHHEEHRD